MISTEQGRYSDSYSVANATIRQVLAEGELGYIYAFPDKRLYTPVEEPSSFVENAWSGYNGEVGIYIHTPFCTPKPAPPETLSMMKEKNIQPDGRDYLCGYCNLFTSVAPGVPSGFSESVVKEVGLYSEIFKDQSVTPRSLYFGGGTPSLMSIEEIGSILNAVERLFGVVSDDKEKAMEGAPDSFDYDKLQALRSMGFNRVSVGVQTFDEGVLHFSGRDYDPILGYNAIRDALKIGFTNVNGDIIVGLPSSTRQTFLNDINTMMELQPNTVTLYQDMTRPVTRFGKMADFGILPVVSQQEIYEWSAMADEKLRLNGYERKNLTCWTKDGGGYKQGDDIYERIPIIGFGPGARSYAPDAHYSTEYSVSTKLVNYLISRWREKVDSENFPDMSGYLLTNDVKSRADIIFGLMSSRGLSDRAAVTGFTLELAALKDNGMVEEKDGSWKYTEVGKSHSGALSRIFFGNNIATQLKSYEHK